MASNKDIYVYYRRRPHIYNEYIRDLVFVSDVIEQPVKLIVLDGLQVFVGYVPHEAVDRRDRRLDPLHVRTLVQL